MKSLNQTSNRLRSACSLLVGALGLTAIAFCAPGKPDAKPVLTPELTAAFDSLNASVRNLPADTYDPLVVLEAVGRDPDKLFDWVRDNTYWVPYRGVLRGATGVLMERVGSDLDRSLLLAELFQSAGFEVRLARGKPADAAQLAASARELPANWRDALQGTGDDLDAAAKADRAKAIAADTASAERTAKHAKGLLASVAPLAPNADKNANTAADALADHWWVQIKRNNAWVDADPTSKDAKLGDAVGTVASTLPVPAAKLTSLPADQVHAVDVKLVVERLEAGKLVEESPLATTLRPAELMGKRVLLTHVPVAYKSSADPAQQRKALVETTEYLPVLYVGGAGVLTQSVTDSGRLNENPNLDRTAGMGKATGNVLGGLGGGLSGAETAKDAAIWSAEWIELTLHIPGKPDRTIRREVFDLIGPAARAAAPVVAPKIDATVRLNRGLSLIGETDLLIYGTQPTPQFLAHEYAQTLLKLRRWAIAVATARDTTPVVKGAKLPSIDLDPAKLFLSPLWGVATGRLAVSPVAGDVYLDQPNVFLMTRKMKAGADDTMSMVFRADLAINDVAIRRSPGQDAFAARVTQGVADTITEAAVTQQLADLTKAAAGKPTAMLNTANLFEAAGGAPLVQLPGQPALDLAAWSADARARAAKASTDGFALVATAAPQSGQVGWWRVDPKTGSTIGVTGEGFHQAMTERQQVEARVNALLDTPFNMTIEEMKSYSQKEFIEMVCRGKGLSGLQLLRVFQGALRLHELILAL